MAELVDASDLKSGEPNGSCGFNSHWSYFLLISNECFK